jgi:WD40 repeat protein
MQFIRLEDRSKDAPIVPCLSPSDGVASMVFPKTDAPSPSFLVSATSRGELSLYTIGQDANEGRFFAWSRFGQVTTAVNDIALTSDSVRLAAAGEDGTIRLIDMGTLREVDSITTRATAVTSVCFAPQNNLLIAGLYTGAVLLFDARAPRKLVKELHKAHTQPVSAVAAHCDGSVFLSTGLDGIARVWDAAGPLLATIVGSENRGLASGIFSPNGRYALLSANVDGALGLWDLAHSGRLKRVRRYPRLSSNYWMNGAFMGDGTVVAGSEDGRVLAYDVNTTAVVAECDVTSSHGIKIPMACAGSNGLMACGGIGSSHPALFELRMLDE